MKLYRFSSIESETQLREAISYIHAETHKLSQQSFGKYLENAGNLAVFSHYDTEFIQLKAIRDSLSETLGDSSQKYYKLNTPIVVEESEGIPGATYTHLYIRQPDPYRFQVGDIDFYLPAVEYDDLKNRVAAGEISGARTFPRDDLDMIELYDQESDVLAYVTPRRLFEKS